MEARVNIKTDGKKGCWMFSGEPFYKFDECETQSMSSDTAVYKYLSKKPDFYVLSEEKKYGEAVRIQNTVYNCDSIPLKLTQVSSFAVSGLNDYGSIKWYDKKRFTVYYCRSSWQGEMQWKKATLDELGLYRASNHMTNSAVKIRSVGSMSTSEYYPLLIIEDNELKRVWFFELEGAYSWYMEIGLREGKEGESLYVEGNCAFSVNDGFKKTLNKGECYTAAVGIYGVTDGTFEDAVRELTNYKRINSKVNFTDSIPVIFNNYMNCNWSLPTDKNLISLIDKAGECGCEIFCIDAGWYLSPNPPEGNFLGDWKWNDERFGDYGFSGIINYIKEKGMLPGVWLEIETCGVSSENAKNLKDCLLKQNGEFIGQDSRMFFDFSKKKVWDYMKAVFDNLYNIGVRYIKNDYNHTIGIGADGGEYPGEKLRESIDGFYDFIDMILKKYPDLIIENCASGAMRCENGTLKHFYLQSISDQEYYYMNPSIISGSIACYPPEKAGIWSYPYPLYWDNRYDDCRICMPKVIEFYKDGEETAFNMIGSMFGLMYLSGHIDYADEFNLTLIKDSISIYKDIRMLIPNSYPCYPDGKLFGINDEGIFTVSIITEDKKTMLVGVFKIGDAEKETEINLLNYVSEDYECELLYPKKLKTAYTWRKGVLAVALDKKYSARLFKISVES